MFFSLLVPGNHVIRKPSDCCYINRIYLPRRHTFAHQQELIATGLDNFIVFGDVYRRDEIDSSHFPVFHQVEGVRLFSKQAPSIFNTLFISQLFQEDPNSEDLRLFENGV